MGMGWEWLSKLSLEVRGVILGWLPWIGSLEWGSELPSFCP